MILSIHGGPYGANTARFDARSQIFAANGYAVLAPNPRGSTGYGMQFETANVSDWGGKDFGDIMAGGGAPGGKGGGRSGKIFGVGGSLRGLLSVLSETQNAPIQ